MPFESFPWGSWLRELLLVQVYSAGSQSVWNSPAWSIACEAVFYLTFPLVTVRLIRLRPQVNLYGLALGLAAVQVALHVLVVRAALAGTGGGFDFAYTSPALRIFEFMIGCVIGTAFLRGQAGDRRYQLGARGRLVTLLVAGQSFLGDCAQGALPRGSEDLVTRVLGQTIHAYAAYTLPFAAIILAYASGPTVGSGLLSRPTLVLLGRQVTACTSCTGWRLRLWRPWSALGTRCRSWPSG
ncbi:acyltransferase family protein [Deinococcus malanensis]|uniref:acyltransferase family protein n=1 Tax=Deinococcus malanensis TaxID=1706855 RepID=UPI0036376EDA